MTLQLSPISSKLTGRKKIPALFGLAFLFGLSGFFLIKNSTILPAEAVSNITGIHSGDFVRIETISGDDYALLYEDTAHEVDTLIFEDSQNIFDKDSYHILINIQPEGFNKPMDVSFVVDRKTGMIQASASGLDDTTTTSLRINDRTVEQDIRSDWSGKTSLKGVVYNARSGVANVCMDIGGYRGGNMSVCHGLNNNNIQTVQLPGIGGIGGGGIAPFHFEFQEYWIQSLMTMTEQLNVAMEQQTNIIGQFLDAKQQLETQRIIQQLQAKAHKDYHPSEQMCTIGTMVRHLALSEGHMKVAKTAFNEKMRSRELASGRNQTFKSRQSDMFTRKETFEDYNCNQLDNAQGLEQTCLEETAPANRNADIDFINLVSQPLTLDIDFNDPGVTNDERNVFSLMNNLFTSETNTYLPPAVSASEKILDAYQDLRSVSAMRSVARNTMSNIISEKINGPVFEDDATPFMRALVQDFGLPDGEVTELIGARPSYYAQMELITKKMYQHPNFITNLYDKPTNVERMRAAMKGIELMQDRDIYDAILRREMLISMLLEDGIRSEQDAAQAIILRSTEAFGN